MLASDDVGLASKVISAVSERCDDLDAVSIILFIVDGCAKLGVPEKLSQSTSACTAVKRKSFNKIVSKHCWTVMLGYTDIDYHDG